MIVTQARRSAAASDARAPGPAAWVRQAESFLRHPMTPAAVPLGALALVRLTPERAPGAIGWATGVGVLAVVLPIRVGAAWVTTAAAVVVAGATAVTTAAVRGRGVGGVAPSLSGDGVRAGLGLGLLVVALPWLLADVGVYVGDVPLLGKVFLSRQRLPPGAAGPAVHLGHHHGLDGALLAATGLALSRQLASVPPDWPRWPLSWSLAGLTVYGLARAAEDGWYEQVVKRGWSTKRLPSLVRDGRPVGWRAWTGLLAATWLAERCLRWEAASCRGASSERRATRSHDLHRRSGGGRPRRR